MYSQLGTLPPQMHRGINGGLGRPYSVDWNIETTDGNVPGRIRSMSELPSQLRNKKITDKSVSSLLPSTCVRLCVRTCMHVRVCAGMRAC